MQIHRYVDMYCGYRIKTPKKCRLRSIKCSNRSIRPTRDGKDVEGIEEGRIERVRERKGDEGERW